MNPYARPKGFTLIETILALTLFAIVVSASASVLNMGLQIWKRTLSKSSVAERKALLALERMTRDIQNTLKIRPQTPGGDFLSGRRKFEFGGNNKSFSLPSIATVTAQDGSPVVQYGRIGYSWDSSEKKLCRTIENATDLYLKKKPVCHALVESVDQVKFRYLLYRRLGETYGWYDRWEAKDGLPQAIEITLRLKLKFPGQKGELERRYERVAVLPVGGLHESMLEKAA